MGKDFESAFVKKKDKIERTTISILFIIRGINFLKT